MVDVSSEENQVKILLEEYKVFRGEIIHQLSAFQKNIAVFSSAVLILFGLSFKESFDMLFIILPFLLIMGYLLVLQDYRTLYRLGRYNQVIEEELNRLLNLDHKIIYWEHLSEDWFHKMNLYYLIYNIALYLPLIIIYCYSVWRGVQLMKTFDSVYCNIFIATYIILLLFITILTLSILSSNKKILEEIKIKMNLQPQTTT